MQDAPKVHEYRSPIGKIARWWRKWRTRYARLAELEKRGKEKIEYAPRDLGITARELRAPAGKSCDAADLLYRRMEFLYLEPSELARTRPAVLQNLQKVCTLCISRNRCAADLNECPADSIWQDYCPNATTLREVIVTMPEPKELEQLIAHLNALGSSWRAKGEVSTGSLNGFRRDSSV